jgi:hypothetical protein
LSSSRTVLVEKEFPLLLSETVHAAQLPIDTKPPRRMSTSAESASFLCVLRRRRRACAARVVLAVRGLALYIAALLGLARRDRFLVAVVFPVGQGPPLEAT